MHGGERTNRSSSPLSFLQSNILSKIKPLGIVGRDKQSPQYTVPENYDRIVSESNQSYDMSAIEAEELPPVIAIPSDDVQKIQVFSVNGPVELDVLINKDSVDTNLTDSEAFTQPRSGSRASSPSCSSENIDNAYSHILPELPSRIDDVKLPSPPCVHIGQSPDMPSQGNGISSPVPSGTIVAEANENNSLNCVAESSKKSDGSKKQHPGPPNFMLSNSVDGTDDIIFTTKPKKPKKKKHKTGLLIDCIYVA